MRRSIFSRIFSLNIVVLLVSIFSFAALEYTLLSQYIYRERIDILKDNAKAIAGFIDSNTSLEQLENFLYGFSRSTKKNILIIDSNCKVIMASADSEIYNRTTGYIDKKYCRDVLSNKETTLRGTLGGVYSSDMFTLQIPIVSGRMNSVIGAIFISAAVPETLRMQAQIIHIMSVSIPLVILVAFVFSYFTSRKLSRPIKNIGKAANDFAHGDFTSRVKTSGKGYNITEIQELAQTFNDMAFSLEQSDTIRNNFISNVSHELRTPMTTISGFIDGILDDTIPPEKQKDYLCIVKDEVSRLSNLVNSFLDVARLKNGTLSLEMTVFDINEVIRRILINFENRIASKNINVNIEFETEACLVKADNDSIKRVLTNLLDNAIKFTDENGEISIKVYTHQQDVFVSIRNTGCGIAESELKFIFDRFYKVDRSRAINREGTGIGLYIVRDILNQHGKDIKVTSREGEFAEFTFSLDKGKTERQ